MTLHFLVLPNDAVTDAKQPKNQRRKEGKNDDLAVDKGQLRLWTLLTRNTRFED